MKGIESEIYGYLFLASLLISFVMLFTAIKWPRVATIMFFTLFAWASWTNWQTSQQKPEVYMVYSELVWSKFYREIINGWFSKHIKIVVGAIAVCQVLIAASMLGKGIIFRIGALCAIFFLLAIVPFGRGSGFPTTLIMALALAILIRKAGNRYLWQTALPANSTVRFSAGKSN